MSATTASLKRAQIAMKLDEARMLAAELAAINIRTASILARLDSVSRELYEGLLNEPAIDIEIQPQIVRSA